jgi:predicted TIM-barrel fold metal-dependent hydrolase
MIVDCHVHICADSPGHGSVSSRVLSSPFFRFVRWRLGIKSPRGPGLEREAKTKLLQDVSDASELDKVVVLAFDAVYRPNGRMDRSNTHLYVTNDYAASVVRQHPKLLLGASVHPYRRDAVAEIERIVSHGAVLLKWLPIVQDFNPADERCFPVYEALAHHRLPLLAHTGGERSLPNLRPDVADPLLLVPALERGVTVVAAHCGTRDVPGRRDYLPQFMQMALQYEHCYGDTAALNLPTRSYAYPRLLADPLVRRKLVHGSDSPIIPLPPLRIGWRRSWELLSNESNWLRRDVLIKRALGFDEDYWRRAANILRLPQGAMADVS